VAVANGLLANDADPDLTDTLTVTKVNGVSLSGQPIALDHGTLILAADGSYTFQPAPDFFGTQTFEYTVSDGYLTDTATASISVAALLGFQGASLQYHYVFPSFGADYAGDFAVPVTSAQFVVGSGVEFANTGSGVAHYTVDVADTTIKVDYQVGVQWNNTSFNGFRITDYSDSVTPIVSASINSNIASVTFDSNNIYVNWAGHVFQPGNGFTITVGFETDNDPIILDLGASGISLTSAPVAFDLNADGVKEPIGWTSGEDGILVSDLDHSGAIENGREVFSPAYGAAGFADALAVLASLDSNGDGVIDARDASFRDIAVWQDLNHDGISQPGELSSLSDHGIVSLDLNAQHVTEQIGGQEVVARGHITFDTGATGQYVAVNLQSEPAAPTVAANEGPAPTGDAVSTASHVYSQAAGDTFHFVPGAGAETISHFNVAFDTIELEGYGSVANYDQLFAALNSDGADATHGDAVINLGHGDSVTIAGVTQYYMQQHLDLVHLGTGV
jgi:Cadherin-like domain